MESNAALTVASATLGIICALPKELAAVRMVFGCVSDPTIGRTPSGRGYLLASVPGRGGGHHTIAATAIPEMGNNASAIAATHLLSDCPQVQHILMVGIAGGVPHPGKPADHVRLGDIIVSDRHGVVQYDLVKISAGAPAEHRHPPRPPSCELLDAVNWLRSEFELGRRPWESHLLRCLANIDAGWTRPAEVLDVLDDLGDGSRPVPHPDDPERRSGHPRVFHGTVAAANILLKDPATRDQIRDRFGVKAVEMEGSGIADATWAGRAGYLVIRGACDYCNQSKGDHWQRYSALVAAAYARSLIESIPVPSAPPSLGPQNPPVPHKGGSPDPSTVEFLYEKAFEHGKLAERASPAMSPRSEPLEGGVGGLLLPEYLAQAGRGSSLLLAQAAEGRVRTLLHRVQAELDTLDFAHARELAVELQGALGEHADMLAPTVRREAYELLASVEIVNVKLSRREGGPPAGTGRARDMLARARRSAEESEAEYSAARPALDAVEACMDALDGDVEGALQRLAAYDDPQVIRRRVSVLVDHDRYPEAAAIVRDRPPHAQWCEKAVLCLVQVGELDRAKGLLDWAGQQEDSGLKRRALLSYAESRMVAAFRDRGPDQPFVPGGLKEDEKFALQDVLQALAPLLRSVEGNERVSSALEEHGVTFALRANLYLENRAEMERLALLLSTRKPLPLALAEILLAASLPVAEDTPRRLREGHPGSFDAGRLASLLEGTRLGRAREAFDRSVAVDSESLTKSQRILHFDLLYALAQELDPDSMRRVERLGPELLASDVNALKLFFADRYLSADRTEAAREILEEVRDENDPRWLQLHAHLMHRLGEPDAAMRRLIEASERVPRAELFRLIAQFAFGLDRLDVVAEALEKVIALDPSDIRSRRNYASVLSRLGRLDRAVQQHRELRRMEPLDPHHGLNEAASLALSGNLPGALRVYEELCRQGGHVLDIVLGRAEVLRLLDRPLDAFLWLDGLRGGFWDEPSFVILTMSLAYAAGRDAAGGEALGRLRELQVQGKAPVDILRAFTLDDLKVMMLERRGRDETLTDQLLAGTVPWLVVEEVKGRSPSLGWSVRTQTLAWSGDDPRMRAEFSVYATNGFLAIQGPQSAVELARIACPDRGVTVAADLTALLTLHSLGRLESACAYFGRILVPASYLDRVLAERSHLAPHQLSQKTSLARITAAIDAGAIAVVEGDVTSAATRIPRVCAFEVPEATPAPTYRVVDVIEAMYRLGRLPRDDYTRARDACRRGGSVDPTELPPLSLYTPLAFDLGTLLLLSQLDCLDPVLRSFRPRVGRGEQEEARRGLREFRLREDVRSGHQNLWKGIHADPRFEFVAVRPPARLDGQAVEPGGPVAFALAASWIACEREVPLLADDRVVQNLAQSERGGGSPLAFGTDRLLERLGEEDFLGPGEVADALMQLMRWRYRFVVPSAGILAFLAGRYPEHPPGADLEEVARYVHDCLADPGLSSLYEPTEPPTSFAAQVRQRWCQSVVQFVMMIWGDEGWGVEAARRLTTWAVRQLLPSLPATTPPQAQGFQARLDHRLVLSLALIASSTVKDPARAHAGLRAIAETLGIGDRDYGAAAAAIIANDR